MPKSVHITTPWPSQEEMVKHLRISKARKRELSRIVEKGRAQLSNQKEPHVNSVEPGKRRKRASAA
jgi:hypothetical protein